MSRMGKGNIWDLRGKVAIVTASTDGIGYCIAERLGILGADVVVSSRKEEHVSSAVSKLKDLGCSVMGLKCHVSVAEDRKNLVEMTLSKFGRIDILVSNAAVNPAFGGILDCPPEVWDKIFEVNVRNALQLTQLVVPHMAEQNGGSIIYISSVAGLHPFPRLGAYSVSKTALIALSQAVANQVARKNIRVNCVSPGLVETKFASSLTEVESIRDEALRRIPMRRFAQPKEIAGIVAYLASDDASYVTGENFVIAGGMQSRL